MLRSHSQLSQLNNAQLYIMYYVRLLNKLWSHSHVEDLLKAQHVEDS